MKKILIIAVATLMLAGCTPPLLDNVTPPSATQTEKTTATDTTATSASAAPAMAVPAAVVAPTVVWPIADAAQRINKKPFGIKVSPQDSPVQPERFSGYHTGVDFETTAAEKDTDVAISAICDGKILVRETASGYGGVLVESCQLDGSPVTVIYGHIRIASVTKKVGDALKAGESFAVLGTGYSKETDGERKHLHLGIHEGAAVSILGYVQTEAALSGWIDFQKYMNDLKK